MGASQGYASSKRSVILKTRYTSTEAYKNAPEFDHIVPVALKGSNETENLRLVCLIHKLYLASHKNIGFETTSFFINNKYTF